MEDIMLDAVVLGAGGFLGRSVARELIDAGAAVRVVGHRPPTDEDARSVWDSAAEQRIADLTTSCAVIDGCREVYHFAADMGGVGYLSSDQLRSFVTNSRITFNVLEAIERSDVERAFLASSACAYPVEKQGGPHAPRLDEEDLSSGTPDKLYGREKRTMIELAEHLDADVRVGVLHTVYGPGQRLHGPRTKFPPAIVMKALAARTTGRIELWGDGQQRRSFLYIDDSVQMILRMMRLPYRGPTNIGFEGAVSVDEITAICTSHLGISPDIVHLPTGPTGPIARDCSNRRFTERYGAMEPIGYSEGFGRMLDWAEKRTTDARDDR